MPSPRSVQMAGMEVNSQGPKCLESHVGDCQIVRAAHGLKNFPIAGNQACCEIETERCRHAPDDLPRRLDFHKSPKWDFIEDDLCPMIDEGLAIFLIAQRGSKAQLFQDGARLGKVAHLDFVLLQHLEIWILLCWRFLIRDKIASIAAQA